MFNFVKKSVCPKPKKILPTVQLNKTTMKSNKVALIQCG